MKLLAIAGVAGFALAGQAVAQTELTMWYHGAGNEVEGKIVNQIIDDFNASQSDWKVTHRELPAAELQRQRGGRGAGGQPARHPRLSTGR